jgi:SAM-dependent methyltransferase
MDDGLTMKQGVISDVCWVCVSKDISLVKSSDVERELSSADFEITDKNYGQTAAIYRCNGCGFMQCSALEDVLCYYQNMDDEAYEATRHQRSLQAHKLIVELAHLKPEGRLLDIGAGAGILVEEAIELGFEAIGVEPSAPLFEKAQAYGLPIINTVLPSRLVDGCFDVVTLVDIIEHVSDPYDLLVQAVNVLAEDGVLLVVTPDARSAASRILGWKWWHYRIAHIGYFNRANLLLLLDRVGLEPVSVNRPSWYFPLNYLLERVQSYLPCVLRVKVPTILSKVTIRLNLYDSLSVVCRRKQ